MDNLKQKKGLIEYLKGFATEERVERMTKVISRRTRHIAVVLEDIYQSHNASAVLRSCDSFGIQDVHVIENGNRFDPDRGVSLGSEQWLTLHCYSDGRGNNTEECFRHLNSEGYTLIALSPHHKGRSITDVPIHEKTALIFGNEKDGLSQYAKDHVDGFARIPMYGFSESFNISVSVSLALYEMTVRMQTGGVEWELNEEERSDLILSWLKHSVKAGDELEKKFLGGLYGKGG